MKQERFFFNIFRGTWQMLMPGKIMWYQKIYLEISLVWDQRYWNRDKNRKSVQTIFFETRGYFEIISIYHVCMVWIEKSVTRVTDRHHEVCRMMPNSDPEWQIFLSTPYTHDRYFFLHTFWLTKFDFQRRICNKVALFPLKSFYSSLTKSKLQATAVRFFTSTFNLHKVTSFSDVTAVKTNVTWRRRYETYYTTNALNTRDFYPAPDEITWVR